VAFPPGAKTGFGARGSGAAYLRVTPSNPAVGSASIVIPAHRAVTQGATAPQVPMLNLTANQDARKNALCTFSYGGVWTSA